jgi:hypothetical protein
MNLNKTSSRYGQLIEELPPKWRAKYHYLAQFGAMFTLMTQLCGREGIEKLEKDDFEIFTVPETGVRITRKLLVEMRKMMMKTEGSSSFKKMSMGLTQDCILSDSLQN